MNNGWIVLWRKMLDKGWFKNSKYVHLWIYLLLKANHEPKELLWNQQIIKIQEGQILTGRHTLMKETRLRGSTIENILETFENGHQIRQETFSKFRIITVLNWHKYQKHDTKSDSRATAERQQRDTNNNDNNDNNDKEDNSYVIMPHPDGQKEAEVVKPSIAAEPSLLEKIVSFWNTYPTAKSLSIGSVKNSSAEQRLLPVCRKITPQIEKAFKKLKEYTENDFKSTIQKYMNDVINRQPSNSNDYHKHRFTFFEFFKQENGFIKFFNK